MRAVVATEIAALGPQLRLALLGIGLDCGAADCVSFATLPDRLAQPNADVILVVVEPIATALRAIQGVATRSRCPVLAVGAALDSQHVALAMQNGAKAYLDLSRIREELVQTLATMYQNGSVIHPRGKTLAVIGASPGAGVTTVAASLAFAMAEHHPNKVALAELGPGVPELALNLDLKPRHSVSDLTVHWDRMDPTMVRQTMVPHAAGLMILAHKPETLQAHLLERPAMHQTVSLLRTMFGYTVLDLGHSLDASRLAAIRLSDCLVVVLRLDVPGLRLARQFIRQLAENDVPHDKLRLVANRHGQKQQIARKQAEEVLGLPIPDLIPDDPATVNQSLNHGTPLVKLARRAAITRSFDVLAVQLNGKAES
jgi:pilus assembly protein CpaE